MRTVSDLTSEGKARIKDFIRRNRTVNSADLADDLALDFQTVVALKAVLARKTRKS
jgi:hypothetical protein